MLRALVAVLLLANLGFWAWRAGAFEAIGLAPTRERDPTRLAQQVRPDAVRVLPPTEALSAPGAAPAASAAQTSDGATRSGLLCLEAGPFEPAAIEAAERALATAALPGGSWVRANQDVAGAYAVVLGPFANPDAAQKKRQELGRLRLAIEELSLPAEAAGAAPQPGFAIGRYDSRGAADAALATFSQRGVRTARVAVLRPAGSESRLRVASATPALAERLRGLGDAALGAGFAPCATAAR